MSRDMLLEAYATKLADKRFNLSDREAHYGFEQGFEAALEIMNPLIEALIFYADKSSWQGRRGEDHFTAIKFDGNVGGQRARTALASLEIKIGGKP